jgi:hypothetical protein
MSETFGATFHSDDDQKQVIDPGQNEWSQDQPELAKDGPILLLMQVRSGIFEDEISTLPER